MNYQKTIVKKLITLHIGICALALCFGAPLIQAAPGDLYVAEAIGGGNIYKFTPAGTRSTFASGFFQPVALAFDRAGNLYVGNSGASTQPIPATITKIAPDGTQSLFATIQSIELLGLAFDGGGNLYVSISSSILRITPDGTQSTFASELDAVWPLAFDRFGNLYAGNNPITGSILKFAPDGSHTTFVTFSGGSLVTALAFDSAGNLFATLGGEIRKVTPDGVSSTFAPAFTQQNALAFDADGSLFISQDAFSFDERAIIRFAPDGISTTFASGPLSPAAFAFEPVTEKLRNLSARGAVADGDDVLIAGFIVGGNALANNAVIVRALGPSLAGAGVTHSLADPTLELHDSSGALIASNNDWQSSQEAQITRIGLAPTNPHEAAIFATLPAGNYTAVVRGNNGATGTALAEVYSVTP